MRSAARPKGTSTKALVQCHEDSDTRHGHEGFVELYILSYRDVDTSALLLFTSKALFVASWKGALRIYMF